MKSILLVEDNADVALLLKDALEERDCRAAVVDSALDAIRAFERESFDLAILDVNLKEGTGYEVCAAIRRHPSRSGVPVIMLTVRSSLEDKAHGFEAGADNYLTKPIDMAELLMWVKALLRRSAGDWTESSVLRAGELRINPHTHTVHRGNGILRGLTAKEFLLLCELARARPAPVSRENLLAKVWKESPGTNTLEVHVKNLRRKLGDAASIRAVRGFGYRIE